MNPAESQDNVNAAPAPNFEITSWFNQLPIRIIGSNDKPYFYAADIGSVLGIKNIRTSIKNFTNTELVSREVREAEGLATYYKYKDEFRRDDSIILLTEPGVYRLVMKSKSPVANQLREHIYSLVCDARRAEITQLRLMAADYAILKAQSEEYERGLQQFQDYQKYNPVWYLFKKQINAEPYSCVDKADRNTELFDRPVEYLYLCTWCPNNTDWKDKQLIARIYGDRQSISDQLADMSLCTNPLTCDDRIYMTEELDVDQFDDSIKVKWVIAD